MAKINGYSSYPTFGWVSYGRLIINFAYNRATSIFFNGELLWGGGRSMTPDIRTRMPRKGGNSFYRNKNDYAKFCVTLCGAPVTDGDVDYATANTKKVSYS